MITLFAAAFACLLPARLSAGVEQLRGDVEFLCDSLCRGREPGTGGSVTAAGFVCSRLRAEGLEPHTRLFKPADGPKGTICRNITARIEAKRPTGRTVLLCAHLDGPGSPDGIFRPGADDNASGVAALLYIAGVLKKEGCNSNVIIAFTDGNHLDRAGAKELSRQLKSTELSLVVCLDILGSSLSPVHPWQKRYLIALGGTPYRKSMEKLRDGHAGGTVASGHRPDNGSDSEYLHLYYDYYGNAEISAFFHKTISDAGIFMADGTPGVVFTSGITDNTNRSSDTPETLDYPLLEARARFIADWISE